MSTRPLPPDTAPAATSKKLGDQVYDGLAEQIAAGRYPIGSRLPAELAQELDALEQRGAAAGA